MDSISRHLLRLDNLDTPILDLPLPEYLSWPRNTTLQLTWGSFCFAPRSFDEIREENSPLAAFINLTRLSGRSPCCLGLEGALSHKVPPPFPLFTPAAEALNTHTHPHTLKPSQSTTTPRKAFVQFFTHATVSSGNLSARRIKEKIVYGQVSLAKLWK